MRLSVVRAITSDDGVLMASACRRTRCARCGRRCRRLPRRLSSTCSFHFDRQMLPRSVRLATLPVMDRLAVCCSASVGTGLGRGCHVGRSVVRSPLHDDWCRTAARGHAPFGVVSLAYGGWRRHEAVGLPGPMYSGGRRTSRKGCVSADRTPTERLAHCEERCIADTCRASGPSPR